MFQHLMRSAVITQVYAQTKNISIDYGVMEKADNVYVALGNFTWSDLGSWASLHEASNADEQNNVVNGDDHGLRDTQFRHSGPP